jgi:hypothetical protein
MVHVYQILAFSRAEGPRASLARIADWVGELAARSASAGGGTQHPPGTLGAGEAAMLLEALEEGPAAL